MEWWDSITQIFSTEYFPKLVRATFLLVVGYLIAKPVSWLAVYMTRKYTAKQGSMIARRLGFWLVMSIAIVSALSQLGFEVSVLLGAAGILTVAVGFASQTSASNLISGLFLIGERPFVVGDVIRVGQVTGEVLAIDLLSAKLKTFDNLYVRVPNEALIKSEIINYTRFPVRRIDLKIGVAYKEDVTRVRQILMEAAEKNPLCLAEPAPLFIFSAFGDSALDLMFCVWVRNENFLELKNSLQEEIKRSFDEQGVEIPYPQRHVEVQLPSEPIRIRVASEGRQERSPERARASEGDLGN